MASLIFFALSFRTRKFPQIDRIEPAAAMPGDMLTIFGNNFGEEREAGFVEIGGLRVTSSSYILWSDTIIRLIIPANARDGFVSVSTEMGTSEGKIFANKASIPVPAPPLQITDMPEISSLSQTNLTVGAALSIRGHNFGSARSESRVYFSAAGDEISQGGSYIPCSQEDYDYELWSDTEIRVRVPDGAASGNVYVETQRGKSNMQPYTLSSQIGEKRLSSKRTYLVQLEADVSNAVTTGASSVTLHVPRPSAAFFQPLVEMTECSPRPVLENYQNAVIHQTALDTLGTGSRMFSQNFAVTAYALTTSIQPARVQTRYTDRVLYQTALQPDRCVQSTDPRAIALAEEAIGNEKNPYLKARRLYEYFLDNFSLLNTPRSGDGSVFDTIESRQGDAYDFAILFCAALRAAEVPVRPIGGILINSDLSSKPHWWAEFYLENFGWVPVDPAMGAELSFSAYENPPDRRAFYFGNTDSQRIVFSRGWNEVKPAAASGKIVYRPRTYALQSIWEESGAQTQEYSSFWSEPRILGLY